MIPKLFQPSIRLKHFITKMFESFVGKFYEGPEPPKRLKERVDLFRLYYPNATAEQWREFAISFGQNCYRDGFVRGYDWNERDWKGPSIEPERVAESMAHDWSLAEQNYDWNKMLTMGYDPNDPLGGVPIEQRRAMIEMMTGPSRFPVEIDLSPYQHRTNGNPGFHRKEESDDG